MWAITATTRTLLSTLRKSWLELAWGLSAAANLAVIVVLNDWVTVPFHIIWVTLTLLYAFRVWRLRAAMVVLVAASVSTSLALTWAIVQSSHTHWDELAEVPFMAALFAVMVGYARRRQTAMAAVSRMVEKQREFLRDASHQLRTPITVARGHAEMVRMANLDPKAVEDVDVVLSELDRLSRISHALLILAAAEHPAFLHRELVEVEPLIVGTARRWATAAPRSWRVEAVADGKLLVDQERLECALDSLIENAVKCTTEDDRIMISSRAEGTTAIIEVADSGIGIAPEHLPRIFDRFSRLNGNGHRNGGTGLGLAIVKAIVEAHGGRIAVKSTVGEGTTFQMRLPEYEPAEAAGLTAPP